MRLLGVSGLRLDAACEPEEFGAAEDFEGELAEGGWLGVEEGGVEDGAVAEGDVGDDGLAATEAFVEGGELLALGDRAILAHCPEGDVAAGDAGVVDDEDGLVLPPVGGLDLAEFTDRGEVGLEDGDGGGRGGIDGGGDNLSFEDVQGDGDVQEREECGLRVGGLGDAGGDAGVGGF